MRLRPSTRRRVVSPVVILGLCAVVYPLVRRWVFHFDEAVILLMAPALGVWLWVGWPRVRRVPVRHYVVYAVVMIAVIAGAEMFAAHVARGWVLWVEVWWAFYFLVAWRLAWAVWKRTSGRLLEARRRAGRMRGKRWPALIAAGRAGLVVFVFAPLAIGSLIHRVKIGNASDLGPYENFGLEEVTFRTADGLTLSGWFMAEPRSDATVVICHGLGANRGNFIDFLSVFSGMGYNALIFDFRGHGDSAGHTATFGLFEDADVRAAVDWLKANRPKQARHVYGLGSSMGAMALVRTAAEDSRIEAVVLDSAYISAAGLVRQHARRVPVVGPAMGNVMLAGVSLHAGRSMWECDAGAAIARLSPRPVLLIHGSDDFFIPAENMELLYERAGEPKAKWLGPGPHSNIMSTVFEGYQRRVIEFFNSARAARD